ncbi:MAG TPA: hypothetical protein VHZ33_30005 [Trebonia sp.]|jgi:hypothetical protein|nr:hypothetical protein [Trebonia sp.]
MNDDQMLTAVRDSFADVRLDVPLDRTVSRGRALRGRSRALRVASVAGAAALAGVAAVAMTGLGRADAPATASSRTGTAKLDAWTVTKAPDGIVNVTIRQFSDEAGLQRTLRADGVPIWVAFTSGLVSDDPPLPRGCRPVAMSDRANTILQAKILGWPADPKTGGPVAHYGPGIAISFHTRQIPDGVGINLQVQPEAKRGGTVSYGWGLGLVATSPTCIG